MKPPVKRLMLALAAISILVAAAPVGVQAKTKKPLTAEQKKKYHAEGLKLCRKKYKMYVIERVEVNWQTLRVTCWVR